MRSYHPSTGVASAVTVVAAAAWGLLWLPIHVYEGQGIHGVWTLVTMNLVACVAMMLVVAVTWRAQCGHMRAALRIGLITGLGLSLYGLGLVHTSVIRATLLFYLTPVWATLIGVVILKERATWQRWAAIALGLIGLVALVGGNDTTPLNKGDLVALLSGVFWAIGAVFIAREGAIPVSGMVTVQFAAFAVFVILIGALLGPIAPPGQAAWVTALPMLGVIAVIALVPGVALLFWAQQFLSPGRVGILMMSEVVVAVISATILLPEERMSLLQWGGAILILAAGIVEFIPSPSRPESQTADR